MMLLSWVGWVPGDNPVIWDRSAERGWIFDNWFARTGFKKLAGLGLVCKFLV